MFTWPDSMRPILQHMLVYRIPLTFQDVIDHVNVARHSAAHAAGQPHHGTLAAAQRGDAVQRAGNACAVVAAKGGNRCCSSIQLLASDLQGAVQCKCLGSNSMRQQHTGVRSNARALACSAQHMPD